MNVIVLKSIDQQLLDICYDIANSKGYKVYPNTPMNNVDYPFITFPTTQVLPKTTKSGLYGRIAMMISIYGDDEQRIDVSNIMEDLFVSYNYIELESRKVYLDANASTFRILEEQPDNKGNILQHGIMDLEFKIG